MNQTCSIMLPSQIQMSQELRDGLDNVIVTASVLGYNVDVSYQQSHGTNMGEMFINMFREFNTVGHNSKIQIHLNTDCNGQVYSIWVSSPNKLLRCSNRDIDSQDLLFPIKVVQLVLQMS